MLTGEAIEAIARTRNLADTSVEALLRIARVILAESARETILAGALATNAGTTVEAVDTSAWIRDALACLALGESVTNDIGAGVDFAESARETVYACAKVVCATGTTILAGLRCTAVQVCCCIRCRRWGRRRRRRSSCSSRIWSWILDECTL